MNVFLGKAGTGARVIVYSVPILVKIILFSPQLSKPVYRYSYSHRNSTDAHFLASSNAHVSPCE